MARFHVRQWLAQSIGCEPEELTIVERGPDPALDILFARNGEPYGQVYLMEPAFAQNTPFGERALIAAWRGGESARHTLGLDNGVEW